MTIILALSSILATVVPSVQLAPLSQQPAAPPQVAFTPSSPVQGSVVLVSVRLAPGDSTPPAAVDSFVAPVQTPDSIVAVNAALAGEPLHFTLDPAGSWVAVGGIPIDATGSIRVPVIVELASGRADTVDALIAVATGEYAMEKLTVAPRFGGPPDSALAARMAGESARARAVSERSHATPRLWDSTWVRPRDTRITSGFGHGREFNGRVQSRHMGVDFAGAVGTPIRAANRGVVALVDQFHLGGNVIYIDHGAGVVTAYLHLSAHEVAAGDTVERGQIIGRVGATGRVTGPHLHWIARYGGITVNPLSLVELPPVMAGSDR